MLVITLLATFFVGPVFSSNSCSTKTCLLENLNCCSSEELCRLATKPLVEPKMWSDLSNYSFAVDEAISRGLSCGIEEVRNFSGCRKDNLSQCSDEKLCLLSTNVTYAYNGDGSMVSWQLETGPNGIFIKEAKSRGLSCGVKNQKNASKYCTLKNLNECSDVAICDDATIGSGSDKIWRFVPYYQPYVKEAKKKRLILWS